jgi:hypothetical protein
MSPVSQSKDTIPLTMLFANIKGNDCVWLRYHLCSIVDQKAGNTSVVVIDLNGLPVVS